MVDVGPHGQPETGMSNYKPQAHGRCDCGGQDGNLVRVDHYSREQMKVRRRGGTDPRSRRDALIGGEIASRSIDERNDPQGKIWKGDDKADRADNSGRKPARQRDGEA